MSTFTSVLIIAWLPVAYFLFRRLPGPVAALIVVIAGQLFLPQVTATPVSADAPGPLPIPIFKFTKATTIGYALLLGSLAVDWRLWRTVKPRWFDLPMAAWCASPLFPAVVNEIGPAGGLYEGASLTLNQTIAWGVPYWCGRLYLGSPAGLRAAAAAIVLGGVVYVPLCLIELRFSPQLHNLIYGYHQHEFVQTVRDGGYRPMVFMEHGLMVGLWMASAALTAFWLWHERSARVGWVALALACVTAMLHSTGATVLGAAGALALLAARGFRTAMPLVILAVLPPIYVAARYTEVWDGQDLVSLVREWNPERAESLDFRLRNEYKLLNRAKERPVFGWGDSGDARAIGGPREKVVTDSLWIITVGNRGLFGLTALLAALMIPVLRIYLAPGDSPGANHASAAALAVVVNLYLLDLMVNAMVNPVFALVAGGLQMPQPDDRITDA
jgi:hypothetical protein